MSKKKKFLGRIKKLARTDRHTDTHFPIKEYNTGNFPAEGRGTVEPLEYFFKSRDLRIRVPHSLKLPSTKNQLIWRTF